MTLRFDLPEGSHSLLHRWDPRWKLAALASAAVAFALLQTPSAALGALAASLTLVALARLPWRWFTLRIGAALLMLVLFVGWRPLLVRPGEATLDIFGMALSLPGLQVVVVLLARTTAMLTLMLVLVATAPLHETLKAAHSLRAPGVLVQVASLAYRYVLLLGAEFDRLRNALRVRGFRNRADRHSYQTIGHVAGTLLVRSHEQAERVAQAMRCRGFDGRFRSLHEFQTRVGDVVGLVLVAATAVGLVCYDWWSRTLAG